MKKIAAGILLFTTFDVFAQTPEPVSPEPPAMKAPTQSGTRFSNRSRSAIAPIFSFGRYGIDGDFRTGVMLGLGYSPNRRSNPSLEIRGGAVLGSTGAVQQYVVSDAFPTLQRNDHFTFGNGYYAVPRFGLGLAFLGVGAVYYLADGDIRPYVGFGANAYVWRNYAGTITPDVKGGLDVSIASGFAGFAEVRHSIGMPNFFTSQYSTFNGLTSFAFGFAFAPRF